jgi:hypothetical protein
LLSFFLRLWFCFSPYFGRRKKITDESLQIMIPVMDLIKLGDSSIFGSFAGHGKNVIAFSPSSKGQRNMITSFLQSIKRKKKTGHSLLFCTR